MKVAIIKILTFILLINSGSAFSQEWNNLKSYQKETGNTVLSDGCWLKKDRKHNTKIWKQANKYNLSLDNGNEKYKTTSEIRDFYLYMDEEIKVQEHEIKWIGIATIAANQLSKLDIGFIRVFIVRNKEIVQFAHNGSEIVFAFAFPKLKNVYFSDEILRGEDANKWDKKHGMNEQCVILEPLYNNLSQKAISRLEKMAKGKGIFNLAVSKSIKYEGKIDDCKARYNHGVNKLIPFYENKN